MSGPIVLPFPVEPRRPLRIFDPDRDPTPEPPSAAVLLPLRPAPARLPRPAA
jgi:hypothetical protein